MPIRPAFRPWSVALDQFPADGSAVDQARFLLRIAALAPSDQNLQPWKFKVDSDGSILVHHDPSRRTPLLDPEGRFHLMAAGAATKLLMLAGEYYGMDSTTELFPEGSDNGSTLVSRVRFNKEGYCSPFARELLPQVARRRTVESEFAREYPTDQIRLDLRTAVEFHEIAWEFVADLTAREHLAQLIGEAELQLLRNADFRRELASCMRTNLTWRRDGVPGWQNGHGLLRSFIAPWQVRTGGTEALKRIDRARQQVMHSPVLLVVGTWKDDLSLMPAVGGAIMMLHLTATQFHLSLGNLNAVMRVPELRMQLRHNLFNENVIPQALLRIGYAPPVKPSPKRPLRAMLVKG
ncbi:MAG: hypothetical protein AB7K09_13930 [Planctomycetota bacterium]